MRYRIAPAVQYLFAILILLSLFPERGASQNTDSKIIRDHQYIVGREFTTESGLPANGVNGMYQDHRGYIWAATYNGLVRYNGLEFEIYNTSNIENLQTSRFISVNEDHEGKIWAGLEYGGFIVIDVENDSTTTYSYDQEKFRTNIKTTSIIFDSSNTPWIGTSLGVFTIEKGEVVYLDQLPNGHINNLIYTEGYIYAVFEEKFVKFNTEAGIENVIAELKDDVIYFGNSSVSEFDNVIRFMDFHFIHNEMYLMTEAGLIRYDGEPEVLFTREDANQAALHGFLPLGDDLYVYGRDGVFSTDLSFQEFVYYNRAGVIDVMLDHEESLWAATMSNGMVQFISTPVYQGPDYDILDQQGITGILKSETGSVFVGANCDGVYEFNGIESKRYGSESGIVNECVWSLLEQGDGTLWVGTWSGGVYFRSPGEENFERFDSESFNGANVFLSIFEDSSENIWFGTYYNGLFRYDGEKVEPITDNNGETLSAVRMIFESKEGDIYVATDDRIGLLSGNEIEELESLHQLEISNYRTITQDKKGRLWFGSYGGGLIVYEEGMEPRTISLSNGLYDDTISQLVFDDDGNLWLGGNLGVFFIKQNQIELFLNEEIDQLRVSRLGVAEGMTIRETNGGFMPSTQLTANGELLIPTVQGVNVIDTNRMALNEEEPNVFIEEVEVDGNQFRANEIESIPHGAQRIIFRFSGLSYINPAYNQYEYKLEGFDNKWLSAGNDGEIIYSSIPHGEYTLKVRASNNDGFWSANEASISFEVIPPFWQTTWFFLASSVLFVAFLIGGFRYRLRSIQRNNRQLQKMVDEHTEELSISNKELKKHIEERNKLQSILAHDLKNPFSGILGYIELIRNEFKERGDQEHVEMMNLLLDSGRNTLNLLENLLQWSGSKEGGLEPRFEAVNIKELVDEAISMTDAQANFKNIFVRNLINEPYEVRADKNMILSVVRNLISNAIKFSGRDSIVEISLKDEDGKVIVSVEDSGVGIPENEVDNIFSSVGAHQKVGTQGEKGIGMGLMLCKEFIDKHDEEIWVKSKPRRGSTFSFSLSKAPQHTEKQIEKEK